MGLRQVVEFCTCRQMLWRARAPDSSPLRPRHTSSRGSSADPYAAPSEARRNGRLPRSLLLSIHHGGSNALLLAVSSAASARSTLGTAGEATGGAWRRTSPAAGVSSGGPLLLSARAPVASSPERRAGVPGASHEGESACAAARAYAASSLPSLSRDRGDRGGAFPDLCVREWE
jgi:hypothetical protein